MNEQIRNELIELMKQWRDNDGTTPLPDIYPNPIVPIDVYRSMRAEHCDNMDATPTIKPVKPWP